ncbi:MAG: OmpA family protein, partial [Polyangiaceae bacterium]
MKKISESKHVRLGLCALVSSLGVLGFSRAAKADNAIPDANGSGMDTHLFRPAIDSKGLFTTNGSDILGANDISFGLVIDYGRTLLRVPQVGQDTPHLINNSFQGTFQFNYGLLNQLVLGVDIPFNLMAGDDRTAAIPGWSSNQLDSQTLGFIALHAKWRITRVEHGIGLALVGQVGVPLSNAPHNAGADPGPWVWPQAVIEKRFFSTGALRLAANAGIR